MVKRIRRATVALAIIAATLTGGIAVDSALPSPAGALDIDMGNYLYRDWGWFNSSNGGLHMYMRDYCSHPSNPLASYNGCRRLIVDEDIWGYGLYNAIDIILPDWAWVSAIIVGTPYTNPAGVFIGTYYSPTSDYYRVQWTMDDWNTTVLPGANQPFCQPGVRRWCGFSNIGLSLYNNGAVTKAGTTSHNTWLAQMWNYYYGNRSVGAIQFGIW